MKRIRILDLKVNYVFNHRYNFEKVISFDHEYDYVWQILKVDQRCQVLNEQTYGKVCYWHD